MKLVANKNGNEVVIVAFLYEGAEHETLKAVYVDDDGSIDAASINEFTIRGVTPPGNSFVTEMKSQKVESW